MWPFDITHATLDRKLTKIMADISNLQAAADQIGTDVQEAIAAIEELKAQVADGGSVTQADLDRIADQLRTAGQALDAAHEPPPAEPTA